MNSADVIVVGAGLIGVSIALELRHRGAQVLVLDRGEPGQESSSAAAGMLAPSDPETPPALRPLATASAQLFPAYVDRLEKIAGVKVDFRRHGTITLLDGIAAPKEFRPLSQEDIRALEPAMHTGHRQAFFVQEDCVDPALLMRVALRTAQKTGVEVRAFTEVSEIRCGNDRQTVEVVTGGSTIVAGAAVNCRGAWSGPLVRPRKGQLCYLRPENSSLLTHVINALEVYMVPRSSGRILVGATVEDVGFDKTVESTVINELHRKAANLVPELACAPVIESWAGLRPGTRDSLPLLGQTEVPGVFTATGHFRNGILLAPVTAQILADLVVQRPAGLDISAFSPLRFAAPSVASS